jgi:mRNA interferase RelE/StbE
MPGNSLEFKVFLSVKALKQLEVLDPAVQKRVKAAIKKLEVYPPAVEIGKIKTRPGEFRLRVGDRRVFFRYQFSSRQVEVIAVRPRERAYD